MTMYNLDPITREEEFLAKMAGRDVETPEPITRLEQFYDDAAKGGGSSVTVEPLTVAQNGTTTAPSGTAYSPVTTNVPNSYGASDEGKVVSNGALVAQTAHAPVTTNGTIDTTLYNSVPINVDGNPNYVETISGTLGNPWGGRFSDVVAMLEDRLNYTVLFKAYGAEVTPDYDGDCIYWAAWFDDVPYSGTPSTATVYSISYGSDGTLLVGRGWFANAWSSLDRNTRTKITIIHHPLPSNG